MMSHIHSENLRSEAFEFKQRKVVLTKEKYVRLILLLLLVVGLLFLGHLSKFETLIIY